MTTPDLTFLVTYSKNEQKKANTENSEVFFQLSVTKQLGKSGKKSKAGI